MRIIKSKFIILIKFEQKTITTVSGCSIWFELHCVQSIQFGGAKFEESFLRLVSL